MSRSWRVTRIAGIDVSVHWTFVLLLAWVLFSSLFGGSGLFHAAINLTLVLAVFGCVVLHELGHAMAARLFGIPTHGITLLPIGGVAQLDQIPRRPWQELVIALAGPAVNVVIVLLLFPLAVTLSGLNSLLVVPFWSGRLVDQLLVINVGLVLFNLLPIFPMDGGRVLRATLAMICDYVHATRLAARIGQVTAVVLALAGLLIMHNPMALFLAGFVFLAAESELHAVVHESRRRWQPPVSEPGPTVTNYPPVTIVLPPSAWVRRT